MIIPAVALKVVGGAFLAGTVVSSIAVPTALSLNSSSQTSFNRFKELQKTEYKDKCQTLIKDETRGEEDKRYLLVCKENEKQEPTFYFFSTSSGEAIKFTELKKKQGRSPEENGQIEIKVTLQVEGVGNQVDMLSTDGAWKDLIDKSLSGCVLTSQDNRNQPWALQCPRGDSSAVASISLTPITY